ncbi:glycoside hydrolase family protein [Mycobacterium sp. ML4]
MQWEKLGQIFEFSQSPFERTFASHAQSPQALVLADRVRIYFSTRISDVPGQFLSQVQYVDYDFGFRNIIGYSNHVVVPLGELGTFDEHGIFPLSPLPVGDKVYGYTNGIARRRSVAVETGAGLVISSNGGTTFKKFGSGPVLSATTYEPFLVGDPFVRIFGREFHMFYLYGKKWSEASEGCAPERVYKIGHAVSKDGINWVKDNRQIVADVIDENECQALPTVMQIGRRYHMYFCFRHMVGFRDQQDKGYRLGYAHSEDLLTWERNDADAGIELSADGWDCEMMCYPNVFKCQSDYFLLYNGNDFGRHGFGLARLVSE